MGLVDHQPSAVALAQIADLVQWRDVALHREDAVHDDQHAAAVALGAVEHLLELVQPVMAEGPELRSREQAAVEDRGMVGGVHDHGVAGTEQCAQRADVGLVAGAEDDRGLGPHPFGDLTLELEVKGDRPVQQPRAGQPGPVAVQGVLRALHHPLVAGQPEVVVRAQHDALRTLHLDHRHRGRVEDVEVGQDVGLAGRAQDVFAVMATDLGEDVDRGGHVGWPPL